MKRKNRCLAFFLAAVLVFSSGATVFAKSEESIKQELEASNNRKVQAQVKIDTTKTTIAEIETELTKADDEISRINGVIGELDTQLAGYETAQNQAENDLAVAQEKKSEQEDGLRARIRTMYMYGNEGYLQVLFSSQNVTDLMARWDMVRAVVKADRDYADALQKTYAEIDSKKKEIEVVQAATEATKQDQEVILAEQASVKEQKQELISKNESIIEEYKEKIDAEVATSEQLKSEMASLVEKARQDAIAAETAENASESSGNDSGGDSTDSGSNENNGGNNSGSSGGNNSSGGGISSSSGWIWPLPGNYNVTSVYGWRIHPIFGEGRGHEGVDIGASHGTAIHAVGNGRVIHAGWYGGYGNCVILDMGDGYQTLYAHMSDYAVGYGQNVSQGQVIGYVGSTGWSTGPHLHIGVYSGATSHDPLDFLPY